MTEADLPSLHPGETLWSLLERRAAEDPAAPLVVTRAGTISRQDLVERATVLAGGLAAAGAAPGDRVAVFADNRIEHIELAFALARLGATYAPVNPAYRGEVLAHAFRTLAPSVVILDDAGAAVVDEQGMPVAVPRVYLDGTDSGSPGYGDLLAAEPWQGASVDHQAEAVVLFTSGTTGPSKGVSLSHRFSLETARRAVWAREVGPGDRLHSCYAFCHANPLGYTLFPALVAGASMAWTPRFSLSSFWDDLRELGATQFSAFSAVFAMLLSAPADPADRDHEARICFGIGSPKGRAEEFEERFGVRIVEPYGLTECGAITYQWSGARRPGSIGKATPGWEVVVVDDDDQPVPAGTIGEIVARPQGPGLLMDGYVGRPDATVELFRNLWFHTGDRGYQDDDGWFWFVDRKKDAIRRRGENISAFEVEEAVLATGLVRDCAAYPVPSVLGEDEVMVAVVPAGPGLGGAELVGHLDGRLPRYALPTYVRLVADLPRTPTGKVEKYKLRSDGVTDDTWVRDGG